MIQELKMTFDPKTIDHLGVKLYSYFPPVIAELISNAYDADATEVEIYVDYENKNATIKDNGHGMTFEELNSNFLVIGRNRRVSENSGVSRLLKRPVTGKKGLGKLAVFGITEDIIISSISNGKKNTFSMNYEDIKQSGKEGDYSPNLIDFDEDSIEANGTTFKLQNLKAGRITSLEELSQSLSSRFQIFDKNFKVTIFNASNPQNSILVTNEAFHEKIEVEFKWDFPNDFIEEIQSNTKLKWLNENGVTGHILTKNTPLPKIQTGFILYSRKKLVQERTFFNDRSNDFFNSYVTGLFTADFIDADNDTDFVATDRKSLLWDASEDITMLRDGLDNLVKLIGNQWRKKREKSKEIIINKVIPEDFFSDVSPSDKVLLNSLKVTSVALISFED